MGRFKIFILQRSQLLKNCQHAIIKYYGWQEEILDKKKVKCQEGKE